jgi:hypothetical protein
MNKFYRSIKYITQLELRINKNMIFSKIYSESSRIEFDYFKIFKSKNSSFSKPKHKRLA